MAKVNGNITTSLGYVAIQADSAADYIITVKTLRAEFGIPKASKPEFDHGTPTVDQNFSASIAY